MDKILQRCAIYFHVFTFCDILLHVQRVTKEKVISNTIIQSNFFLLSSVIKNPFCNQYQSKYREATNKQIWNHS